MLENIFLPVFQATIDPHSNPELSIFLKHVSPRQQAVQRATKSNPTCFKGDQHFITSTYLCALTGLSPQEVGFVGIMAIKWKSILDLDAANHQICAFEHQASDSWYLIRIPFSAKKFKTYLFTDIYNTTCHWICTCQPRPRFKTSYCFSYIFIS